MGFVVVVVVVAAARMMAEQLRLQLGVVAEFAAAALVEAEQLVARQLLAPSKESG